MSDSQRPATGGETNPAGETDTRAVVASLETAEKKAVDPLIEEAAKKAAIAWLNPGGAVWCLWLDQALYVINGPGEQPAAGLANADTATVTLRGDHGGRIVTWQAKVTRVDPAGEEWATVTPTLAAKRLNVPAAEDTVARWATTCTLTKLTPTGAVSELPDDSQAAPPPAAAANRRTKVPFMLRLLRRPRWLSAAKHSDEQEQTQ